MGRCYLKPGDPGQGERPAMEICLRKSSTVQEQQVLCTLQRNTLPTYDPCSLDTSTCQNSLKTFTDIPAMWQCWELQRISGVLPIGPGFLLLLQHFYFLFCRKYLSMHTHFIFPTSLSVPKKWILLYLHDQRYFPVPSITKY